MADGAQETKKCKYCQSDIHKKAKICPFCRKKQGGGLIRSIVIVLVVLFIILVICTSGGSDDSSETKNTEVNTKSSESVESNISNSDNTQDKPPIETASSYKDMKLGDIGVKDNVYVGLSYIKQMSYLPTALGKEDDIGDGNEVILCFFDFYNNNDNESRVSPSDITCYVDGTQVEDVETYIKVNCDGIKQYHSESLAGHTQLISVQDYEVPIGWSELKLYYKSECVWTISQEDVSTDDYSFESMYPDIVVSRDVTPDGAVIYDEKFEIKFQGVTDYTHSNKVYGDKSYVVFKFTINNTGESAIDYSLAGYSMSAYQNNYFLGDATYTMDDKIDGYSNIFNINSIESGMSANVYVAFESFGDGGNVYMIYDDGYITSDKKGVVYCER